MQFGRLQQRSVWQRPRCARRNRLQIGCLRQLWCWLQRRLPYRMCCRTAGLATGRAELQLASSTWVVRAQCRRQPEQPPLHPWAPDGPNGLPLLHGPWTARLLARQSTDHWSVGRPWDLAETSTMTSEEQSSLVIGIHGRPSTRGNEPVDPRSCPKLDRCGRNPMRRFRDPIHEAGFLALPTHTRIQLTIAPSLYPRPVFYPRPVPWHPTFA